MNRDQTRQLLQKYKDYPDTEVFYTAPSNYPLFHEVESFTKDNWNIQQILSDHNLYRLFDFAVEELGRRTRLGDHCLWRYVARNTNLKNTMLAYVQQDLYCRYVGRCNPLKTPHTTHTFIPWERVRGLDNFNGKIGKDINLYLLEIDLDIIDIEGKWNDNVPWHYLQQTINWKPYTGRIQWQDNSDIEEENQPQLIRHPDHQPERVALHRNVYAANNVENVEDVRQQSYLNMIEARNRFENRVAQV